LATTYAPDGTALNAPAIDALNPSAVSAKERDAAA
jgi:hypothetical protein